MPIFLGVTQRNSAGRRLAFPLCLLFVLSMFTTVAHAQLTFGGGEGVEEEVEDKNMNKIIKNVAAKVTIDKMIENK